MRVQLTPSYMFVCDRCGKKILPDQNVHIEVHRVAFKTGDLFPKSTEGEVCETCFDEFNELAHNFFDEVNKEVSECG